MAKRIGVLEADQALNAEPRRFVKKSVAKLLVRRLEAVKVAPFLIKMVKIAAATIREVIKGYWDGPLGTGNVLPFGRKTDGRPLHYEIGPRSLWAKYGYYRRKGDNHQFIHRGVIKVSARPQSHLAAQLLRTTTIAPRLADALPLGAR